MIKAKTTTARLEYCAAALLMGGLSQQAHAVSSSVTVSTTATISYDVGATAQPTINALADFRVDKKVDVLVTNLDGAAVSVSPGQTTVVLAFSVTNQGNDTQDIVLADTALAGGAAAYGGTDNFDISSLAIYQDSANSTWEGTGTETDITAGKTLSNVASGATEYVYLVGNVPTSQADTSIASYFLKATVHIAGGGAAETETGDGVADSEDAVDVVFADGSGANSDAARDGSHTVQGEWKVAAATLAITKTSAVIDDYVSASNFKRIPGALIEYTIAIDNTGGADAVNLSIADVIDTTNVTFQTAPYSGATMAVTIIKDVGGTPVTTYQDSATVWATPNLSITVGTVAAGTLTHVKYQVVIN
jgi:uncharacterized repeat protein (TIGR01451 family)